MSATSMSAEPDTAVALRTAQMIVGSLASGVLVFAAFAAFAGPLADPPEPIALGLDAVALAAIAITLGAAPMSFVLSARTAENARSGSRPQRLQAFRTGRILGAALCEGPALLWCVGMLLSGNRWYLAPIAILIALMLLHFPTRDTFETATGTPLG